MPGIVPWAGRTAWNAQGPGFPGLAPGGREAMSVSSSKEILAEGGQGFEEDKAEC